MVVKLFAGLFTAGILLAPSALADTDTTTTVVIAINPQTGGSTAAEGPTADVHEADVLARCTKLHPSMCVIAGSAVNGCVGVAQGRPGYFSAVISSSLGEAEAGALAALQSKGSVAGKNPEAFAACSDGTTHGFDS